MRKAQENVELPKLMLAFVEGVKHTQVGSDAGHFVYLW